MIIYISGRSTKNSVPLKGEDFPVLGAGAPPPPIHRYVLMQNICHNCVITHKIYIFVWRLLCILCIVIYYNGTTHC